MVQIRSCVRSHNHKGCLLPLTSSFRLCQAAGAFGRAQLITSAYAFAAWTVHGMQVMSMAFTAPVAAAEFDADRGGGGGGGGGGSAGDAAAMKLTASFFFAGWMLGLSLWGGLAALEFLRDIAAVTAHWDDTLA